MSNSLLTPTWITKEAVAMFRNTNAFLMSISRKYEAEYKQSFKIGGNLEIRLPVSYTVGHTATVTPQATNEQFTTLVVSQLSNVATSWTDSDFALKIDDFKARYLDESINYLAADVAANVMATSNGVANFVSKVDGSSNIIAPDMNTWLDAGAKLDNLSANRADRVAILSPRTHAQTVGSMAGLFNPTSVIGDQYKTGQFGGTMTFGVKTWMNDQTVINHTTGTATGMNIDGATVSGSTLTVDAISGTLKAGDVITIANVNSVNRLTRQDTGELAQFCVTADVLNGATSIPIFPAFVGPDGSGNPTQYQTVNVRYPADEAVISFASKPSEVYVKNLVYKPDAFALVTVDLPNIENGVVSCVRERFDGISMRYVRGYDVTDGIFIDRLDVLFGACMPKQDWAVIVAAPLS